MEEYSIFFGSASSALLLKPLDDYMNEVIGEFDPLTLTDDDLKWRELYLTATSFCVQHIHCSTLPLPSNIRLLPESNRGKILLNLSPATWFKFYARDSELRLMEITYSQMWIPTIVQTIQSQAINADLDIIYTQLSALCDKYGDKLSIVVNHIDNSLRFEVEVTEAPTIVREASIKTANILNCPTPDPIVLKSRWVYLKP